MGDHTASWVEPWVYCPTPNEAKLIVERDHIDRLAGGVGPLHSAWDITRNAMKAVRMGRATEAEAFAACEAAIAAHARIWAASRKGR